MIQDGVVRWSLPSGRVGPIVVAASLMACAHTREDLLATTSGAEAAAGDGRQDRMGPDPASSPGGRAAPSRPRLSHTVTLGQGAQAPYMPSTVPAPPVAVPSSGVMVNNHVVVQGAPQYPGGYLGYGGYSYGAYGRPSRAVDGHSGAPGAPSRWGASGWEGPRRTAAPGQTPGVGGNWSPPPSFGPATMK